MTISTSDIQALYIAYFNRPADFLGLDFWKNAATAAGSVEAVANSFAASNEYKSMYAGKSTPEIINTIYLNLFGRAAEPAGIKFWGQALDSGFLNVGNIAYSIFKGAQNEDKIAVQSKVTAAEAFYASLDTSAEIVGYSGPAANAVVSDWLKGITTPANLAANTTADALAAVSTAATAAHDGAGSTGTTLATTLAIDTLVGTTGNDTINVYASGTKADGTDATTLSANDSIDGGAGIDTLNLEVLAGPLNGAQVGTVKNVEIINIAGADLLATGTIDATKYQGSTNINIQSTTAATVVTVTGLSGKTLGVGAGYTAASINADSASAVQSVALTNVADALIVDAVNTKTTTLNVSGTVADTAGGATGTIDLNNTGAKVATLNLNLKADAKVDVAGLAALASLVSTGTSGVEVVGAGTTLQNITTAGGADTVSISFVTAAAAGATAAKNATVSSGAGADTIAVTTTGTGLTTVDAGGGDDTVTVTKSAGNALSISGGTGDDKVVIGGAALATTDVIDGGDGTDTIAVAGSATARVADDFIVLTKVIKNFESLALTSAEGAVGTGVAAEIALDASKLAGYTKFTFEAGASFVNSVAANQTVVVASGATAVTASAAGYIAKGAGGATSTTYAGTLTVNAGVDTTAATVTARADTVNLTVKAIDTDVDATLVSTPVTLTGDVKTAVVTVNNGIDAQDGVTLHDNLANVAITTATTDNALLGNTGEAALGNLASLTLSGSGSATVVNADSTKLVTVDASALGGTYTVTADGHTAGAATVGLSYTSTNSAVESIKLGSGIDALSIGKSTYGSVDSITGLNLVLNAAGTALTAASDTLAVTGATTAVKATTTQTDIDLALKDIATAHTGATVVFAMGGDTYVYHDAGTAGSVDAADVLVKLVGTVNLDALVVALG
ncbi:DUF4214 domain-containing protein [Burkholderia sp. LMU1-1-1.1]|uniref:DUF4214 domain-containing protein n=1 Tax=Burkholderia sp. LMU1-1-1.1 TaxID=3135266 RepID=UPI003432A8FA